MQLIFLFFFFKPIFLEDNSSLTRLLKCLFKIGCLFIMFTYYNIKVMLSSETDYYQAYFSEIFFYESLTNFKRVVYGLQQFKVWTEVDGRRCRNNRRDREMFVAYPLKTFNNNGNTKFDCETSKKKKKPIKTNLTINFGQ